MIWDGVDVRALWAIGFGILSIKEDAHSDSLDILHLLCLFLQQEQFLSISACNSLQY